MGFNEEEKQTTPPPPQGVVAGAKEKRPAIPYLRIRHGFFLIFLVKTGVVILRLERDAPIVFCHDGQSRKTEHRYDYGGGARLLVELANVNTPRREREG